MRWRSESVASALSIQWRCASLSVDRGSKRDGSGAGVVERCAGCCWAHDAAQSAATRIPAKRLAERGIVNNIERGPRHGRARSQLFTKHIQPRPLALSVTRPAQGVLHKLGPPVVLLRQRAIRLERIP